MTSEDQLLPHPGVRQRGPAPTGTRLLLVRHGESHANARGVAGGPLGDGGLTELGRAQARALAQRLALSRELAGAHALYTSTLPRAIETGDLLASGLPGHLSPVRDEGLNEVNVGEGDGLTWAEFKERFGETDWDAEPHKPNAPGGESLIAFYERCEATLHALAKRHPGELVICVCHGGVIEQAMKIWLGVGATTRLQPRIENCSMTEFEVRDSGWRLLRYNDLAPLPAE